MYQSLENVLKPFGHKEGRTLKLAAVMLLLLCILAVLFINRGASKESDLSSLLPVGVLAMVYVVAIPLGRLRTRQNLRKNFARFTEAQLQRMDMDCADTIPICGIVVTSYALACEENLIPISDIVWVYEQNSTKRGVATINYLIVIDKNHQQYQIPLSVKAGPFRKADPEAVGRIKEQLLKRSPGIYCGYNAEIVEIYRKNFAGMVARVEEESARLQRR
ncbi:MAG: hypothetical protein IJC59_06710 [Lachnospiraceae bacterium]|nr:hypothetical protein [Lachnospiraceae bacterium]